MSTDDGKQVMAKFEALVQAKNERIAELETTVRNLVGLGRMRGRLDEYRSALDDADEVLAKAGPR